MLYRREVNPTRKKVIGARTRRRKPANTFEKSLRALTSLFLNKDLPLLLKWLMLLTILIPVFGISTLLTFKLLLSGSSYELDISFMLRLKKREQSNLNNLDEELKKLIEFQKSKGGVNDGKE